MHVIRGVSDLKSRYPCSYVSANKNLFNGIYQIDVRLLTEMTFTS